MPDPTVTAIETPAPDPMLGATPEETFTKAMERAAKGNETETKPPADEKPKETPKETKQETKAEDDLPDSLITGKKSEAKPAEDDILTAEPPAKMSKESTANWISLRDTARKNKETVEALRKENEALKSKGTEPSEKHAGELKTLREQLDQANAMLEQVAYERTPHFQEKFTDREQRFRTRAVHILTEAGIDSSVADRALALTGKSRDEFLDGHDLSANTRDRLAAVLVTLDDIAEEKAAELVRSRERLSAFQEQEKRKQEENQAKEIEYEAGIIEETHNEMITTLEAFQKVEGESESAAKWNREVDDRKHKTLQFIKNERNFKRYSEIVHKGFALDGTLRLLEATRKRVNSLAEENARLKGASPEIHSAGAKNGALDDESGLSADERAKRTWQRLVENRQ